MNIGRAGVTRFIPAFLVVLGLAGTADGGPPADPFKDPSEKPQLERAPQTPGERAVQRVAAAMRSTPDYPATESAVEFALYLYAVSRDKADLEMARRLLGGLEGDSFRILSLRTQMAQILGKTIEGPRAFVFPSDHLEKLDVMVNMVSHNGSPEDLETTKDLAGTVVQKISEAEDPLLGASVVTYSRAAQSLWEIGFITGNEEWKKTAKTMLATVLSGAMEQDTTAPAAALAAARMESYPVQMVLIGSADDPVLTELREASNQMFEPRKLILNLDPVADAARIEELFYPAELAPVLFVCVESICSPPIQTAEGLQNRVREILDAAAEIQD